MLIEYIERLRTKSPAERRRVALVSSGVVTLMIGLLWATSLPTRIGSLTLDIDTFKEGAEETGLNAAVAGGGDGLQEFIASQESFRPQEAANIFLEGTTTMATDTPIMVPVEPAPTSTAPRPVLIATSSSATN